MTTPLQSLSIERPARPGDKHRAMLVQKKSIQTGELLPDWYALEKGQAGMVRKVTTVHSSAGSPRVGIDGVIQMAEDGTWTFFVGRSMEPSVRPEMDPNAAVDQNFVPDVGKERFSAILRSLPGGGKAAQILAREYGNKVVPVQVHPSFAGRPDGTVGKIQYMPDLGQWVFFVARTHPGAPSAAPGTSAPTPKKPVSDISPDDLMVDIPEE